MGDRIEISGLEVDRGLYELIDQEIAPGTGIESAQFWQSMADIIAALGDSNKALLDKRDRFQQQLDEWHKSHFGKIDPGQYKKFLLEIGYLVPEGEPFQVTTENVDKEVALVAGPQLAVPVNNARYSINAANARWCSLYDALYGTDVIPRTGVVRRPRVIIRCAASKLLIMCEFSRSGGSFNQSTATVTRFVTRFGQVGWSS